MAARSRARLRSSRRLSLVLDLDHTLVECTMGTSGSADAGVHEISVQGRLHRVRLRPKLAEFFDGVEPLYEATIYTHGSREYALAVASLIERTVSSARFGGRIVSRDDCPDLSAKSEKRLDRVFPGLGGTDSSFIVDDRHDVWVGDDFDHLVLVEPYKFFDRRKGRQGTAWDADAQLVYTRRALVDVHNEVFAADTSAAEALATLRRSVFSGIALYFVCPPNDIDLCKRFATVFGATLADSYKLATHVVVDERRRDRRRKPSALHPPALAAICVHLDWFWFSVWHLAREDDASFFVPPHEIILQEDLFLPPSTLRGDLPPAAKRPKLADDDPARADDDDRWADDFADEIHDDDDDVDDEFDGDDDDDDVVDDDDAYADRLGPPPHDLEPQ